MFEDPSAYHSMLNAFIKNPSKEILEDLVSKLRKYHEERPPCPNCGNFDIHKFGTNPRKEGRHQQYRCKKCLHIYNQKSIETKEIRENYPKCPRCNGKAIRRGFWEWENKDGTKNKVQRYYCDICNHWFRIQKKRQIKRD